MVNNFRFDIESCDISVDDDLDEDEDLSPLDAEMKSAQMIERVLNGLPL